MLLRTVVTKLALNYIYMKCYILLFGEAFREGNQGTRIRDLDTSYDNQINTFTEKNRAKDSNKLEKIYESLNY